MEDRSRNIFSYVINRGSVLQKLSLAITFGIVSVLTEISPVTIVQQQTEVMKKMLTTQLS